MRQAPTRVLTPALRHHVLQKHLQRKASSEVLQKQLQAEATGVEQHDTFKKIKSIR